MKFNNALVIAQLAALSSAGLIRRDDQCSCTVDPMAQIGCCWGPTDVAGAPWCFYTASGGKTTECQKEEEEEKHQEEEGNKSCEVDESSRTDCGYYGINKNQCIERGCCWSESSTAGVPWCFNAKSSSSQTIEDDKPTSTVVVEPPTTTSTTEPTESTEPTEPTEPVTKVCPANESSRKECGYLGITRKECIEGGCCWEESETAGVPWCFNHEGEDITIEKKGITVRFQKPQGWSTVNLWAWDSEDNNVYGEVWPGKPIEQLEDGWYSYTFPSDITSVNVLFNDGTNQTSDISNIKASSCYKLVGSTVMKTDDCGLGPSGCTYTVTDLKTTESGMTAVLDLEDRVCE
eukprot:jgi/Orpsp1_1/1187794/evm.model.d7180000060246.1